MSIPLMFLLYKHFGKYLLFYCIFPTKRKKKLFKAIFNWIMVIVRFFSLNEMPMATQGSTLGHIFNSFELWVIDQNVDHTNIILYISPLLYNLLAWYKTKIFTFSLILYLCVAVLWLSWFEILIKSRRMGKNIQ